MWLLDCKRPQSCHKAIGQLYTFDYTKVSELDCNISKYVLNNFILEWYKNIPECEMIRYVLSKLFHKLTVVDLGYHFLIAGNT